MEAAMAAHAKRIEIEAEDRPLLEKWAGARATERRLVDRARIVLMAGEGRPASEIAQRVGCSLPTVKTWRTRYERDRLDGLRDLPKAGRPLTHGPEVRARLIALACTRPPDTPEGVRRERWPVVGKHGRRRLEPPQAPGLVAGDDRQPSEGVLALGLVATELKPGE
jgi:hypothetical protein